MAPYSGDMFESVARSASESAERPSPQNSTKRPTTPCLRSISVSVSTRSVAVTPSRSAPGQAHADDRGRAELERLAEHHGLGLDAADAEAEHAEAVDHRRVRVGADERVGHGDAVADRDDAAEVLEVDLVHDAHARRHDAEGAERALGPAQQQVALDVALVLALDVVRVGLQRAGLVDLHRVVDHEVARHQRVDARRVAAGARHGRAHRGEVDDGGHAGEVLQQHARGEERHALARRRAPAGQPASASTSSSRTCSPPALRSSPSSRMRTVCGSRCVSAAPRLVEPVDPEEIGHARQARAGAKQVACHRLDSIAARARRRPPRQAPRVARSARTLSICAIRETWPSSSNR